MLLWGTRLLVVVTGACDSIPLCLYPHAFLCRVTCGEVLRSVTFCGRGRGRAGPKFLQLLALWPLAYLGDLGARR